MAAPAEHLAHQRAYEAGNQYWYEFDNTATWLAEVLDGNMRTSFEFSSNGREMYSQDGVPMGEIFDDALQDAERTATENPNLLFEVFRRYAEKDEYGDWLAMARGERPNTMIVVSDFPHALMDATEDVGGYNITRKQTMLRVIIRRPNGTFGMTSQSLDLSDRSALEEIYKHYGLTPEPGELLGQRIFADTSAEEQPYVVDRLTGVYDRALATQYGGEWYAGRQGEQERNTYDFARQQTDLLDYFVQKRLYSPGEAESMRYNLAAAVAERYTQRSAGRVAVENCIGQSARHSGAVPPSAVELEMLRAGGRARAEGKGFSGCGMTARAEAEQSARDNLQEAGYGNKTDSETVYKFDKKAFCVVCQHPPKKDESPKWCGPCSICRTCDATLKKSGKE